jgi:rare lipoprotein A (peptidoglycan hydrolase)
VFAEQQAVSTTLVAAGLAYLYPDYLAECPNQQALEQAEREAKQQRRGLWARSQPKPWDYRREFAAQQLNQSYQQWLRQTQLSSAQLPQLAPGYLRDGMQATGLGLASWYGPVLHGRLTANGEKFDQNALTVAHASLPFNSRLKVTNLNNGKSVIVRVNDRHPTQTVSFDLSKAAAEQISSIQAGVVPIEFEMLPSP